MSEAFALIMLKFHRINMICYLCKKKLYIFTNNFNFEMLSCFNDIGTNEMSRNI